MKKNRKEIAEENVTIVKEMYSYEEFGETPWVVQISRLRESSGASVWSGAGGVRTPVKGLNGILGLSGNKGLSL